MTLVRFTDFASTRQMSICINRRCMVFLKSFEYLVEFNFFCFSDITYETHTPAVTEMVNSEIEWGKVARPVIILTVLCRYAILHF